MICVGWPVDVEWNGSFEFFMRLAASSTSLTHLFLWSADDADRIIEVTLSSSPWWPPVLGSGRLSAKECGAALYQGSKRAQRSAPRWDQGSAMRWDQTGTEMSFQEFLGSGTGSGWVLESRDAPLNPGILAIPDLFEIQIYRNSDSPPGIKIPGLKFTFPSHPGADPWMGLESRPIFLSWDQTLNFEPGRSNPLILPKWDRISGIYPGIFLLFSEKSSISLESRVVS